MKLPGQQDFTQNKQTTNNKQTNRQTDRQTDNEKSESYELSDSLLLSDQSQACLNCLKLRQFQNGFNKECCPVSEEQHSLIQHNVFTTSTAQLPFCRCWWWSRRTCCCINVVSKIWQGSYCYRRTMRGLSLQFRILCSAKFKRRS